jgi:hypothetical protein
MAGIALHYIFTPSKVTPIVEDVVTHYVNAEVGIGEVELTFFSTFPNLGIRISNIQVISKVLQDITSDNSRFAGRRDSLLTMDNLFFTMDPIAYLSDNKVDIKELRLETPRIYAYTDTSGISSWEIYKTSAVDTNFVETQDTSSSSKLDLNIQNVLIKNGTITYNDRREQLFAGVRGIDLELNGNLKEKSAELNLDIKSKSMSLRYKRQTFARRLKLDFKTKLQVDTDSLLLKFRRTLININGAKLVGGGRVEADTANKRLRLDIRYGMNIPALDTLLAMVPNSILDNNSKPETKGSIRCRGAINGWLSETEKPTVTAELKLKNGYIHYPNMPAGVDELALHLNAMVDLNNTKNSFIKLDTCKLKGGEVGLDISGEVANIIDNPHITSDIKANINFEDITRIFPLSDSIKLKGLLDADMQVDFTLADIQAADYGKLKIRGKCEAENIAVFIPEDSVVVNLKYADMRFSTNRESKRIIQGNYLFSGIIICSNLDFNVRKEIHLVVDTTFLSFRTTELRDTTAVANVSSSLRLGKTVFMVRDTLLLGLRTARVSAKLRPSDRNKKIPTVEATAKVDSLRIRALNNRLRVAKADIRLSATRSRRDTSVWIPSGDVTFTDLRAFTPYFPLRIRMPGTNIHFDRREFRLDSAAVRLGSSDVYMTGKIHNFFRSFVRRRGELKAELDITSKMINCNQIMRALDAGTAYANKVSVGYTELLDSVDTEMGDVGIVGDSVTDELSGSIFVLPDSINFSLNTKVDRMIFGKLRLDDVYGKFEVKDKKIKASGVSMKSAAADMNTSMMYYAPDTSAAFAGIALEMKDIRIDSLVRVVPSLDSLFPMLVSFEGNVDFNISAETWLDSKYNVKIPTLKADACVDGSDLVLMDGQTFAEISKMLMFKNKKRNMIDTLSIDFKIHDGEIEIFPFLLEMDRYRAAIGGKHNMDMTFDYHISILKSPLPFKAGIDITGSLENMKYRVTKAKYKNLFKPTSTTRIDTLRINLQERIKNMLREGY